MSLPAAFVSVILIWSTTPLAIKWSALGIGSSFAVFSRMAIGTLLCSALLLLLRVRFPLHRKAVLAYLVSGVSMFGAMALTYWSAQSVSSGMISVLFGLSPLLTSLGAMWLLKEEALTPSKLAGILMGLLGLALVFRGALNLGEGAGLGLTALFLAVTLQSSGLVWLKRIGDDSPPLATTLGSLLVALPLFFASWWLADGHWPTDLPVRAVAATVYLAAVGSVLGFMLYYYMIKHMETGRIALITLITPVMALLLGQELNDEAVLPQVWLGTASILFGLCLHRWGARWWDYATKMKGP
ncbi:MAG TPA: DMT family transporter [Gallionella sp.]|nr:DMT family transporter [Gallionella sp.]